MMPQFTLISFHCNQGDLTDQLNFPSDLAHALDSTKGQRVELYLGTYVYDTTKDWQNIHRLCEFLRTRRHTFLRLPFEEELFAYTDPKIAQELKEMEVKLYTYPELDR